jgi:hypothetical protein
MGPRRTHRKGIDVLSETAFVDGAWAEHPVMGSGRPGAAVPGVGWASTERRTHNRQILRARCHRMPCAGSPHRSASDVAGRRSALAHPFFSVSRRMGWARTNPRVAPRMGGERETRRLRNERLFILLLAMQWVMAFTFPAWYGPAREYHPEKGRSGGPSISRIGND